jgi:hypothetical protein
MTPKPDPKNPFVVGILATGKALANRAAEVERIVAALTDVDRRLIYYGDRRMGKSSALEEAAIRARKKGAKVAVADLATATGMDDAAKRVLEAVYHEVGRSWRESIERIAGAVKARISWTPPSAHGMGEFSLAIERGGATSPTFFPETLKALNAELERRRLRIGLAIDEFQRLFLWGGEDAQWALKSAIERHRQVAYVLTGSSRSVIAQFVASKKHGMWKAADALEFGPIAPDEMVHWIRKRSGETGVAMDVECAQGIVVTAGPRTRDIVQLARGVWDGARVRRGEAQRVATRESVGPALDAIVGEQAALFTQLWTGLPRAQQRVLAVLAGLPDVQLMAEETLARFDLGAKSTVSTALESLMGEETLQREQRRYVFDDPYYRRWVQLNIVGDLGLRVPDVLAMSDG